MTNSLAAGMRLAGMIAVLLGILGGVTSSSGEEPAREFLAGLRERGYYDMAVEYLEQMKTSPLAPMELKETLLYELGTTLIQSSRDQRDIKLREAQLEEAGQSLQRFVGMLPDHPLVTSANSQLGNLKVERARIKVEQAKQPGANKAKLLAEAAEIYADAYAVFDRAQIELRERLSKMNNIPPDDKKAHALRDTLRTDYLQAKLLGAAVKEEAADTAAAGSAEQKELLTAAAEQYGEIYEKWRTRLAGLYARMYQGRCSQRLGNHKDALSYFSELLEQPDNPDEFRVLKTKTLLLAMDSWRASKLHAEAVQRLGTWVDGARPNESKDQDWLELRLGLAKAQWLFAQDLKSSKPKDPQVRRSESDARKNAQAVSRSSGDIQQAARKFLAEIGLEEVAGAEASDPKNFDEAKQAGRDALDALQTANLLINTLPGRIAKETDAEVKADLSKQLAAAQETVQTAVEDAKTHFRTALALADDKTDIRDLNVVHYFLCYLHYTSGEFLDAALLGEFLARRYPDSSGARQGAKIAMAAYLKLYAEEKGEDRKFESDHAVQIAKYITQKWPDQEEAVEALNTLIPFMIQAGDLQAAESYLTEIPEDSPKRGDAEIKTGQAMWGAYLRGMQQLRKIESGEDETPAVYDPNVEKQRLDDLKTRAQRILVDGIARMGKSQPGAASEASATAALSLAQIYLDTEQIDKCIELLEDPGLGPLTLVKKKDPAAARAGYDAETYKTALRAYISSLPQAPDADAVIAKASEVMDAMKQTIDQQKLIGIYYSLARDLEAQMNLASAQSKQALSKGFETFLLRLRANSKEFTVLSWVADTFAGIAASFDTQRQPTAESVKYYQLAADTYQSMLDDGNVEDEKLKIQVRLRLANAKRRLRKFTEARDLFVAILKSNPSMVNVQVEAAKLYQDWASFPGKEALFLKSIQGSEIDPATRKPIIWGWQGISTRTAGTPAFRNVFHESRYNLAVSLHGLALAKTGSEKKKYLEMASRAITQTQQLFGSGEEWETWKPEYDKLLKTIQKALGQKPAGLDDQAIAKAA